MAMLWWLALNVALKRYFLFLENIFSMKDPLWHEQEEDRQAQQSQAFLEACELQPCHAHPVGLYFNVLTLDTLLMLVLTRVLLARLPSRMP
jgi:hypothetical protein